jgi:hypothetical protein
VEERKSLEANIVCRREKGSEMVSFLEREREREGERRREKEREKEEGLDRRMMEMTWILELSGTLKFFQQRHPGRFSISSPTRGARQKGRTSASSLVFVVVFVPVLTLARHRYRLKSRSSRTW